MTWDPYDADLVNMMPAYLLDHQDEWRVMTVLICFDIVEMYLPDRVMRQFRLRQHIPTQCDTSVQLHRTDRRGKGDVSWAIQHGSYIALWDRRLDNVVNGQPFEGTMDYHDPYMVWYRSITRLYINPNYTPPSTHYQPTFDSITGYVSVIMLSFYSIFVYKSIQILTTI